MQFVGFVLRHAINSLVANLVHVSLCSSIVWWSGQCLQSRFVDVQHAVGIVIGNVGCISAYLADADKSIHMFQESID